MVGKRGSGVHGRTSPVATSHSRTRVESSTGPIRPAPGPGTACRIIRSMATPTLRVFQLNVGSLFEPEWERRRHEVVSWIDHLQPDVVCLQEVWETDDDGTGSWVAANSVTDWHRAFGGDALPESIGSDPDLRFGSTILSRWPVEEDHHLRLAVGPDADPITAGFPWEVVHARTAGLDVFSTHLAAAPRDGAHRRLQVVELDRFVRSIRGSRDRLGGFGATREAMPAILCGDFNAEPDSDEIRFLCGLTSIDQASTFWQDAWRMAGDGPGLTQDWRVAPLAAALNVHRKRIDYVFVGDPFRRAGNGGRVLRAELFGQSPRTGLVASDHLGLCVDVVWPDRP